MNLLIALSLGTSTPEDSHLTRLTCDCQSSSTSQSRQAQSIKYSYKHSEAYMTTAVLGTSVVSSLLGHTAVPKTTHSLTNQFQRGG